MTSTLFIVQIVLAILITIAVLLQKSSSIGLGAYSGSNESVFGAKGPAGFLTKITFILGLLFIINTLALGYFYSQENKKSAVDTIKSEIPAPTAKPFVPATPAKDTKSEATKAVTDKKEANTTTNSTTKTTDTNTTTISSSTDSTSKEANASVATTNSNTETTNKDANTKSEESASVAKSSDSNSSANSSNTDSSTETNTANNNSTNGSNKAGKESQNANSSDSTNIESTIASIVEIGHIKFETDSSTLTTKSIDTIKKIADILRKSPNTKIEIGGHTDSQGNASYNKKLSQERVDAVKRALVDFGIKAENLTAVGYGDTKPLVDNKTAENRAKNRRVEFKVVR